MSKRDILKCKITDRKNAIDSMIISKNVVYNDIENTLKTDVVEIDLKSKDIKFYMYDKSNKVNVVNNN